ncbi:MAG: hypothetical protein ACTSR8_14310 [Promethearchaeota archaeon]
MYIPPYIFVPLLGAKDSLPACLLPIKIKITPGIEIIKKIVRPIQKFA